MKNIPIRDEDTLSDALMECCNGQCNQGRDCPVRQACEMWEGEFDRLDREGRALALWFFGSLAVIALAMIFAVFA